MSQKPEPAASEARSLLDEIRQVFKDVRRGDGVSLHETEIIDMYGSDGERRAARRKDTDQRLWQVQDEWIEKFGGVGGLSFFDEAGFCYYLPAYMSYFLRKQREPNSLTFHLSRSRWDFDLLFSPAQKVTIARFLEFVCSKFHDECLAPEVFNEIWARHLKTDDRT